MPAVAALGMSSLSLVAAAQDAQLVAAGEQVFNEFCSECHGVGLTPKAGVPDLRRLRTNQRDYFNASVMNGRAPEMPAWEGVVTPEQLDQIWAYIQAN